MKIMVNGKNVSPRGRGKEMKAYTSKYFKITEYKFDKSIYDNLIPEFNAGFEYVYEDVVEGNVTTRTIYSNELPNEVMFGRTDGSPTNRELSLLEVPYLNIGNITNLYHGFNECANLYSVNTANWNTTNIESIYRLFGDCRSLTSIDVSNWDTSKIINMQSTFYGCESLAELNLSGWDMGEVTNMSFIFYNTPKLKSIIMNNSDYNSINKIIVELPTRTTDNPGILNIVGVDDISLVDIETLNSKYWTITSHTILNNAILSQTKLN